MKIAPIADVKARLLLAHSPRSQALLDESRKSILAGKGLARGAFWNAVAARQRKRARLAQMFITAEQGRAENPALDHPRGPTG